MPNKFKYNKTGTEPNSIFKGNWAIDTTPSNSGGGPSATSGFYNGANIPEGGYTIYSPNGVFVANNDTELVDKVNSLGANVTGASGALTWAAGQSTHVVLNKSMDNIVTSGLVLNLDASHVSSFNDNQPIVNLLPSNKALLTSYNDHGGTHETDATFPLFGNASLRTTSNESTSWNGVYLSGLSAILTPGVTYTYSFYIYFTSSNTTISYFGYGAPGFTGVQGQWNRVSTTFVATTQDYFYVTLQYSAGLPITTYYLANLQIEAGSSPTPFVNGSRSQNTAWSDLSGSNNTGTLVNGPSFDTSTGGAIVFDGVDDYIHIPHSSSIAPSTGNISVEAIFKAASTGVENGSIIFNKESEYEMSAGGGYISYAFRPNWAWVGRTPFNTNQWYHTMLTYDQSYQRLYVNGVEVYSAALSGAIGNANSQPLRIGARGGNAAANQFFNGSIPVVKVYNRALTAAEISQNYYGGPTVTNGLTFALDAGNLVSYESGSTTTYNLAGSNTGTLVNAVGYNTGNSGSWTFDGGDDYIQTNLTGTYSQITYEFMGFFDDPTLSTTSRNESAFGDWNSNRIHFGTRWSVGMHWNVNGAWNQIPNTNLRYGWNHYVLVWDNVNNKKLVYLNGILSDSSTTNGAITMGDFKIGVATNLNAYYRGNISVFKTYTKALTSDEVLQNFNAQRNRFGI